MIFCVGYGLDDGIRWASNTEKTFRWRRSGRHPATARHAFFGAQKGWVKLRTNAHQEVVLAKRNSGLMKACAFRHAAYDTQYGQGKIGSPEGDYH